MQLSSLKKLLGQSHILDIESDSQPFTHKFEREYELWRDDKDTHIKPSAIIAQMPNIPSNSNDMKQEIDINSNPKNDQTEFEKDLDVLKNKVSNTLSNNDSKDIP